MIRNRQDGWWTAALAGTAIVLIYLAIGHRPWVGVADNGDFLRVMKTVGIDYLVDGLSYEQKYFRYAMLEFRTTPMGFGGYVSTHLLFLFAAKGVNALAGEPGVFHMASLGAVYAACFAAAVVVIYNGIQASRPTRLAVAALLVFVFTDVAYTAYYHSFFGEPASMLALLFFVGFGLHAFRGAAQGAEPSASLAGLFLASLVLTGAKSQNALLGLVGAALLFLLARSLRSPRLRRRAVVFGCVLLAACAAVFAASPNELKRINLYQTVFFGMLKHSDDVSADLRELGLPETLKPLAGTNYFQGGTAVKQDDPRMDAWFYDRVGHFDVGLYYLRHPIRLIERLAWAADHSTAIRPYYLGSYTEAEGRAPGAIHLEGGVWSEWKRAVVPRTLSVPLALAAIYTWLLRSRRVAAWTGLRGPTPLLAVPWIAAIAYVTPIVGDGDADLGKHLFLYNVAFDLLAVAAAGLLAGCAAHGVGAALRRMRTRWLPAIGKSFRGSP
ncbi:hypothetical protein MO973_07530 [Paenibacillus sp. TRM 82003]|nr:hypothetical protein [Paenibacillus sp. TRM 82003]